MTSIISKLHLKIISGIWFGFAGCVAAILIFHGHGLVTDVIESQYKNIFVLFNTILVAALFGYSSGWKIINFPRSIKSQFEIMGIGLGISILAFFLIAFLTFIEDTVSRLLPLILNNSAQILENPIPELLGITLGIFVAELLMNELNENWKSIVPGKYTLLFLNSIFCIILFFMIFETAVKYIFMLGNHKIAIFFFAGISSFCIVMMIVKTIKNIVIKCKKSKHTSSLMALFLFSLIIVISSIYFTSLLGLKGISVPFIAIFASCMGLYLISLGVAFAALIYGWPAFLTAIFSVLIFYYVCRLKCFPIAK